MNDPVNKRRAEALYRAVGEIDDRYVSEALEYRAASKRSRLPRALAAVAAVLLVAVLSIGLLTRLSEQTGNTDAVVWTVAEGYDENVALLACLSEHSTEALALDSLPALDDGTVRILWRDESDGTCYAVTVGFLSMNRREKLESLLKSAAASVASGADAAPYSLWISMGDGTVVTPYLAQSSGNVFYGTPAEYAPEQLPPEALARLLTQLIEENLD